MGKQGERSLLRPIDIKTRLKSHIAQLENLRYTGQQLLAAKITGHIDECCEIGRIRNPDQARVAAALREVAAEAPEPSQVEMGQVELLEQQADPAAPATPAGPLPELAGSAPAEAVVTDSMVPQESAVQAELEG